MSASWNYSVQQELEPQPLNMALLLLQQELAELGSSVPVNRQFAKDDQHIENISTKHLEPSISIKEEPQSLSMNYSYPSAMPGNFNMVPQVWPLSQPLHLQRMEQNFCDLPEKTILNLDDVKEEATPEKCNVNNEVFNQTPECNKCNMPQYPQEPVYRNEMYPKRMCASENFYNFSSLPYPGPSNTWYSVKTFTGRETVNRWDVQAENMKNYNNSVVDRNMPPSPVVNGQNVVQSEVLQGPMAHPDQFPMCRVCGKGFATKEQLINHMMVHRSRKPHVCEICEKSFSSPGNLKTHIMIHTGQKPHSCEKCGKRFTTLGNLKTHSVVHTAEKPHPCQVCGKGFTTLGNLKTHLLIHTGERPYICEVCGKRFTTRGNVKAHSVTHTAEKPFVCHVCGKNFSHKGNLKTHIVSRHMASKQQFDCVVCGRNFSQVETLNTHVALVHSVTPTPINNLQEDLPCEDPHFLPSENIVSV
ncbi:myoneurin-like [Periplaneta americana]|uniref:myoneurin-like n=1 Tax=Periplaneta americana TaxID=6978 RepID=UPI0037E75810